MKHQALVQIGNIIMFGRRLITSLAIAFGMAAAAGCENKTDLARKPALVDSMVNDAIALCDTSFIAERGAPYATRLSSILMNTTSANLDVLKAHAITVTLDRRLSSQETSKSAESDMKAVLYKTADNKRILALWDNGVEDAEFLETSAKSYASSCISYLAEALKRNKIDTAADLNLAGEFSYIVAVPGTTSIDPLTNTMTSTGPSTKTEYEIRWMAAKKWDADAVKMNKKILSTAPRRDTTKQL